MGVVGHVWSFGSGRLKLRERFPVFEISLDNIARLHLKPNKINNKLQEQNRGKEDVVLMPVRV